MSHETDSSCPVTFKETEAYEASANLPKTRYSSIHLGS